MNESANLQPVIDRLMVNAAVQGASIEALLFLCRSIAQKGGITQIEGLPLDDWFQRQKLLQLESVLLGIEDENPSYAARLQSVVDESRRRLDGNSPQ